MANKTKIAKKVAAAREKKEITAKPLPELLLEGEEPLRVYDAKIIDACQKLIDSGFNELGTFKAVYPNWDKNHPMIRHDCARFWRRPEVQDTLKQMILGRTDELTEKDIGWAIDQWRNWLELSILDYYTESGEMMTPAELKKLPRWMQSPIKAMEVTEHTNKDGEIEKRVKITLIDKERALHDMSRAMKWITAHVKHDAGDGLVRLADEMAKANARRDRIENEKIIEHDPQEAQDG